MYWNNNTNGRKERRLPIALFVLLDPLEESARDKERTYTDNISPHGVRVVSKRAWQPGQCVEIVPVREEAPVRGEVVYCQKVDERFFVGFKFADSRLPWSILQRFDGIF